MKALLLSSSKADNTGYLEHALPMIREHHKDSDADTLLFIPFAGVSVSYDDYTTMVADALKPLNLNVIGIHQTEDPVAAIQQAKSIAVGGGNTFHLLYQLYQQGLLEPLKTAVANGALYTGWSAGSNIAGLTIRTTNDMPIIQPPSFDALQFIPCQLNPHYTDYQPPGFHGETRQMRLEEFMVLDSECAVIGIQEGTALSLNGDTLQLIGNKNGFLFRGGEKSELPQGADLSYLL